MSTVISLPSKTEEYASPSPGDCLPPFRDTFPDSTYLDDEGCDMLCRAIVIAAAQDYYDVALQPIKTNREQFQNTIWPANHGHMEWVMSKDGLHYFVHSSFFNMISDIEPGYFERVMIHRRQHGQKIPNITDDNIRFRRDQKHFTHCYSVDI